MEKILHQLRLVVYPIIYKVLAPSPQVVGDGISEPSTVSWGWEEIWCLMAQLLQVTADVAHTNGSKASGVTCSDGIGRSLGG